MADRRAIQEFTHLNAANDISFIGGGGGPPHDQVMEAQVTKLEDALQGINITLATMTEQLKHLVWISRPFDPSSASKANPACPCLSI